MPITVVLCKNIYDENGAKHFRGAQFEASQDFCDMVLAGDAEAEREPRIAVIEMPKRGRPRKDEADADS